MLDFSDNSNVSKGLAPLRGRATARRTAGQNAPLGNSTKLQAKIHTDLTTIEVDGVKKLAVRDYHGNLKLVDVDGKRELMYERQNSARLILGKDSRIRMCLRWNASGVRDSLMGVKIAKNDYNARYQNLSVCGLGWLCPVCAHKISEHRRKEVQKAQDAWDLQNGKRYLITWTFPHNATDSLADLFAKLKKARLYMAAHRSYKNFRTQTIGSIRTVEVTFGSNGWHPHVHEIWFAKDAFDLEQLKNGLFKIWAQACQVAGLPSPSIEHGVDIKSSQFASDYVAKWGFEMTRWHQKLGHGKGMTPFQFLDAYADASPEQAAFYRAKFNEFATVTKGSSQLQWSKGLRAFFKIDEKTDEELAKDLVEEKSQYVVFATLTQAQWAFIRDFRKGVKRVKSDLRADVLKVATQSKNPDQVFQFLEEKGLTKDVESAILKKIRDSHSFKKGV